MLPREGSGRRLGKGGGCYCWGSENVRAFMAGTFDKVVVVVGVMTVHGYELSSMSSKLLKGRSRKET